MPFALDWLSEFVSRQVLDVVGVGRPLCGMPDASKLMLEGEIDRLPAYEDHLTVGW